MPVLALGRPAVSADDLDALLASLGPSFGIGDPAASTGGGYSDQLSPANPAFAIGAQTPDVPPISLPGVGQAAQGQPAQTSPDTMAQGNDPIAALIAASGSGQQGQSGPLQSLPTPPMWAHRNVVGDVLDNLFLGGAIQGARGQQFKHDSEAYKLQLDRLGLARTIGAQDSLPDRQRTLSILAPKEFVTEATKPVTTPAGDTTTFFGDPRTRFTADKTILDNGRIDNVTFGPDGPKVTNLGDTGPDLSATPSGAVVDRRGLLGTGAVNTVPIYNHFPASDSHGWAQANAPGQPGTASPGQPADPGVASPSPIFSAAVKALENGGKDMAAQNGSSTGRYQFKPKTFYGLLPNGDINNPDDQDRAFGLLTAQNAAALKRAGLPVNDANLYLLHQQGAPGGIALLKNPDANAVQTLTNSGIYKNSAVARQAITRNYGTADMTGGQFAGVWAGKTARAIRRAGGQAATPPGPAGAPMVGSGALGSDDITPGRTYTMNADGTETDPQDHTTAGPNFYSPEHQQKAREAFYSGKDYEASQAAVQSLNSLHDLIKRSTDNNGILDITAINSLARIESGRSATQGSVLNLLDHIGAPEEIKAKALSLFGKGAISPEALQWVEQAMSSYAKTAFSQASARAMNEEKNARALSGGRMGLNLQLMSPSEAPQVKWFNGQGGGGGGGQAAALQSARDAIQKGAPRDAVVARLKAMGVDPGQL